MKKHLLVILLVCAILICGLTSCEANTSANKIDDAAIDMANFKAIEGEDGLAYNLDTRVVYYMFSTSLATSYKGYGYAYFAPYISENGRFCRYINDEIVEIIPEANNN